MATSWEIQKRVSQLAEKLCGARNIITLLMIAIKRAESIDSINLYGDSYQNKFM